MDPTSEEIPRGLPSVISGSCACGLTIYNSSTLPISITLCHCSDCRKACGAPFLSFGLFHNSALQWTSSKPGVDPPIKEVPSHISIDGTPIAIRGSCSNCGSPLFMKYHCRPDGTSVVMGIVNDASIVGKIPYPKEHIFLREKAKWWDIRSDDGLAQHESFNQAFESRLAEWVAKGGPKRSDILKRES